MLMDFNNVMAYIWIELLFLKRQVIVVKKYHLGEHYSIIEVDKMNTLGNSLVLNSNHNILLKRGHMLSMLSGTNVCSAVIQIHI